MRRTYNRELLNDPRTDEFWLPIRTLKMARALFAGGSTCEQIARLVLASAKAPEKSAVLNLPESERLAVVMMRLEMADPASDEHDDYKRLLARIRGRREYERRKARMTEEDKEATRERGRENMRRRREDPEYMQQSREYANAAYHRRKEADPVGYEEMLIKQRRYYYEMKKMPEGRAKLKEYQRRGQEARKQRKAVDPWFLEKERAYARAASKRYRDRQKAKCK